MLFSPLAYGLLATSFLSKEVAGRYDVRKRGGLVIEDVVITEAVTVVEEADGTFVTQAPGIVGTTTIDGTTIVVSSTVAPTISSTAEPTTTAPVKAVVRPSSVVDSAAAKAFAQDSSSSSSTTPISSATPTTSTTAVLVPTTSTTAVPVPTTSFAVAVAPTTSSTATSTSPAPTTPTSGDKRGLAYNDISLLSAFVGSLANWCYNWASTPSGTVPGSFEYVPMLWGLESSFTSLWDAAVKSALASGSTHILSFNEPDLSTQSNIGYQAAAAGYMTYMQPYAGQAKLGSPAVTNGDPASGMGLGYLTNFMNSCHDLGCQVDFITIHWYDTATNIQYFQDHVTQAYTAGGNRPVWITEFGASGTTQEQQTFLDAVLPWLDAQPFVERYAYFWVADGSLISGTSVSALGETFAFSA
jgi:hypothetical protein